MGHERGPGEGEKARSANCQRRIYANADAQPAFRFRGKRIDSLVTRLAFVRNVTFSLSLCLSSSYRIVNDTIHFAAK